jgi:hypothetical protein
MSGAETDTNTVREALRAESFIDSNGTCLWCKRYFDAHADECPNAAFSRLSGRVTELEQALERIAAANPGAGYDTWTAQWWANIQGIARAALAGSAGQEQA